MRIFHHKITMLGLLLSLSIQATPSEQPRLDYQKITQLLSTPLTKQGRTLAQNLLPDLKGYPLYPYAEFRLLNARPDLTSAQIQTFSQTFPDFPLINELKKTWRKQLQQKQDWQTLLTNASVLPQDQASQCVLLQAQAQNQTREKLTALFNQKKAELSQLWLTDKNLPNECDGILALWQQQGELTEDLIKQRALLAFEGKNAKLLNYLENTSSVQETKAWIKSLNELLASPALLKDNNNPFSFEKLTNTEQDKRILNAIMPAYIKTLSAQDFKAMFAQFEDLANQVGDTSKDWKIAYLTQFFDEENAEFQQWKDEQLLELKDDKLTERRLRQAIRQKDSLSPWIDILSEEMQQRDEWQYWRAKQDPNKTQEILTALAQQRSFFGVLAAQELNQTYQPELLELAKTDSLITADSAIYTALQRVSELRTLQDFSNMNLEWKALLERVDFEQKLRLAEYAYQQDWFDLGVQATIQAKAWGYVSLRMPNAYLNWFDLHLNDKKISRTFAMAIARQESAFRPNATSSANARGLMQLLPSTAKLTAQKAKLPYKDETQLLEPFDNIMLGTAYLQELYDKFGDNRILIAAAYNAGPNRVAQWLTKSQNKLTMAEFISSIPFLETRNYVQSVLTYDAYYQILQQRPQQLFSKEEYDRLY